MAYWIFKRTAAAFIALVSIETLVFGQVNYAQPGYVSPISYNTSQGTSWGSTPSNVSYAPANGDLAERVAELEATLKSMQEKEAAAKKKAASKPTVKLGGRIHWDTAAFDQDAVSLAQGRQYDGTEFRRARLKAYGEMFDIIDYKFEIEFAATDSVKLSDPPFGSDYSKSIQACDFKDVYVTIRELPYVGHIRIGHFKEPFSLEELTSSNNIGFMERSTANNAFSPERNSGIMMFNSLMNERMTWAIGGFVAKDTSKPPIFKSEHGGLAVTGRITGLLWYDEATPDRGLWHVGAVYSYRDMEDYEARFRARPECHLASYVVDTGTIADVGDVQLVNFQTAYVWGPVTAQAEWYGAHVDREMVGDSPYFNGCYGQLSWFLTGENRKYKKGSGVFGDVTPNENFFRVRAQDGNVYTGMGAWEVLYRYSYLDLTNLGVNGGLVSDHTIGVNWYLNPYMRLMFNYVNSTVTDTIGQGNMDIFETRVQVVF